MSPKRQIILIAGSPSLPPSARDALGRDFDLHEVATADEARQRIREGKASLVLLDAEAPGEAGSELCRELAQKNTPAPAGDRSGLKFGDIEFDVKGEGLRIETPSGPVQVDLTHHEFRLLLCLARASGKILSRDHLIKTVWSADTRIIGRTVDTHVCKLRKKMAPSRFTIHSVYGAGYRFVEPSR